MNGTVYARRPSRSLRTTLMFWFLFFSLVPLALVTGYFVRVYDSTIDNEVRTRLRASSREVAQQFRDLSRRLRAHGQAFAFEPGVAFALNSNTTSLQRIGADRLKGKLVHRVGFVNRRGRYLLSAVRTETGTVYDGRAAAGNLVWEAAFLERARLNAQMQFAEFNSDGSLEIITVTRVRDRRGELAGFIEEVYIVQNQELFFMGRRLNVEVALFDEKRLPRTVSHSHLLGLRERVSVTGSDDPYSVVQLGEIPMGFWQTRLAIGETAITVVLGISKAAAVLFQRKMMTALLTIVGILFAAVVFLTWLVASKLIVQPIQSLVLATQVLSERDRPELIPITSDDELGVLTASFNDMSNRIYSAQTQLRGKIEELESAYGELKDTQARLVHTAKMASLGQLVAGVAHELNNPIGFIYSNMEHLRDYSQKLIHLLETAERSPKKLEQEKKEIDYEFLVRDLPKLIKSCEDGARRTRDIVVGLRNFSRLEEAKLQQVNLRDNVESTLQLLAGDIKNRIQIETHLDSLPLVTCFPSQLNQVFMNILANAVQAIQGPGQIRIDGRSIRKKGKEFVSLSFVDSGPGIKPEVLEKIFDPFFTTKGVGQGTGLGLSISYGIVRKHGGDITVKSEVGKGSEFIVVLPVEGPVDVAI